MTKLSLLWQKFCCDKSYAKPPIIMQCMSYCPCSVRYVSYCPYILHCASYCPCIGHCASCCPCTDTVWITALVLYTVQVTAPCIRQVTAFLTLQTISLILDTVQVTAPVHCMLLPLYCTLCKYCPCKLFKSLPLYCTLCKSLTLYTASHCPCTLCKSLLLYTVQVTAIVLHTV